MTARPSNIVRWLALTLALGLTALALIALACGPSAPAAQEQPLPECTAERSNPETDDCIKPTDPPTNTPKPTPTTPLEVAPAHATQGIPATPVPSLADQITDTVQNGNYDAIARVRVVSHRHVTITPTEKNFIAEWTRSQLEVTDTLRGSLPATIEVVTSTGAQNASLDVNGNYILFLRKSFVDAGSSQYPGDPTRIRLTQAELTEFGGEGFNYLGRQAWAVDGATVYRIPVGHIVSYEVAAMTDLEAARADGETMTLAALEQALRPANN